MERKRYLWEKSKKYFLRVPFHVNDPRRQNCKTKCCKTLFAILNAARSRRTFFGKLREGPCAAGGKRPAAQGRPHRLACPGCQKPREGQRGKEGRFRYPRGPASWPARLPTLGCPSSYICLQKRIPDMFFQKISKKFFDSCARRIITMYMSHFKCMKTARNAGEKRQAWQGNHDASMKFRSIRFHSAGG